MPDRLDLVVLVPDKQMEATLRALLLRPKSLAIRQLRFEILVHPRRDPGCRGESAPLLSIYQSFTKFALVLFDREGCGEDHLSRESLEAKVGAELAASGWSNRAAVIVIDPELESWVWSDSPVVDEVIGWSGNKPSLREWLVDRGHLVKGEVKPARPKESLEAAIRQSRKRLSASLFAELAKRVGLSRCSDSAFQKFKVTLATWFPTDSTM